mmetsp:Transcript_118565/g.382783  ORF Transcript_118565/g.382783 Transcript_118565/m.382783 type:complete len:562 (-) Transcript_118565:101-1786(-)
MDVARRTSTSLLFARSARRITGLVAAAQLSLAVGNEPAAQPKQSLAWTAQQVFDQEAGLRHEIAELQTEVSWLRLARHQPFWPEGKAFQHLEGLQMQIAALRREVAWLHRESAIQAAAVNPLDVTHAAGPRLLPPGAEHGRAMFITMCAGATYFDTYCGPFLASFERAYGAAASQHRVVVFHVSIEPQMLEVAKERFSPWAHFQPLWQNLTGDMDEHYNTTTTGNSDSMVCEWDGGRIKHCNITEDGLKHRGSKVSRNNYLFPFHVASYLAAHGQGFCYAVLIDSDTLFVRPIGRFLPKCELGEAAKDQVDWDVAFTVYDPEFMVPWAEDPADVGRTARGFSRVNTGVILLNLLDPSLAQAFLPRWAEVTAWLTEAGDEALGRTWVGEDKRQWEVWHDELLVEFKGPNQAGLVLLVCSYRIGQLRSVLGWGSACGACSRPVEAQLELLADDPPLRVRFRALPARILNHPESMPDGNFPPDLMVVHLKGLWWRNALPRGATFLTDDHRRSTWNRDSLALHRLLYETWHFALPPEARPVERLVVRDNRGREVSHRELAQAMSA